VGAAGEGDGGSGLALVIEDEACDRFAAISKGDGARGAESVGSADGNKDTCLGVSIDVAGIDEERGLRGLLLDCGWGCERGNCNGTEVGCNPEAGNTNHVHLLQT
jgi:hypothetical protein